MPRDTVVAFANMDEIKAAIPDVADELVDEAAGRAGTKLAQGLRAGRLGWRVDTGYTRDNFLIRLAPRGKRGFTLTQPRPGFYAVFVEARYGIINRAWLRNGRRWLRESLQDIRRGKGRPKLMTAYVTDRRRRRLPTRRIRGHRLGRL